MCVAEDFSEDRGAETVIYTVTQGEHLGEYAVACATGKCDYSG
jgi:hypothetical protein